MLSPTKVTHPSGSLPRVLLIAGLLLIFSSCSLWLGLGLFGGYSSLQARAPARAVIEAYMQQMAARDVRGAYALFSPRAQVEIPETFLAGLQAGANTVFFDGYQGLSIATIDVIPPNSTSPAPGEVFAETARVTGPVRYAGGLQGSFCATLEMVEGRWLLAAIFVNVPPDKVK